MIVSLMHLLIERSLACGEEKRPVNEEELKPGDRPYDFILGLMISVVGLIVFVAGVVSASYVLGVIGFIDLVVGLILIGQSDSRR